MIQRSYGFQFWRYVIVCAATLVASATPQPQATTGPAAGARQPESALAPVSDRPGLPRVLLIGDSISVGYTLPVRDRLKTVANVHRVLENCGPTTKGLEHIDEWLGEGRWDVIHFNWGLHDLKQLQPGRRQVSLDAYEANLKRLVTRLKQTGATLIWATTTPVPEGAAQREPADVPRYNEAALRIMRENNIVVNDLYAFALPRLAEIQLPRNVHYTPEGYEKLAGPVIETIRKALDQRRAAGVLTANSGSAATAQHDVYETEFHSNREYANPAIEVELTVVFTSASGKVTRRWGFWDGGDVWRVRFSPDEVGQWTWESRCSDEKNRGLHGQRGSFKCVEYAGKNSLFVRGPLKLSANRRYLVHSDGTPFFWLADTAWNGVLKAKAAHWDKYLATRRSQGFTAVQFVATQWRFYDRELAYTEKDDIRINPEFFKRLDAKVKAINDAGLVASPVMMWAVSGKDPGHELSEQDAIWLGRYMVARWGAHNILWMLAGDGVYLEKRAERWRKIGGAVFGDQPTRPATMHPLGFQWIAEEFGREPWYSIIGYQSAHREKKVAWLVQGPPATDWREPPTLPVINLEPNYEAILAYDTNRPFDALAVRRALYRSLLVSPTAGVTYGHHGIWYWTEKPELPLTLEKAGIALPWDQAIDSEGARSVKHLARLFHSVNWWTLVPDPALVANQPTDPMSFAPAARSEDGSLALIYLPQGGDIELNAGDLKTDLDIRWFNPSIGKYFPAGKVPSDSLKMQPPDDGDWLLVIGG
ncbi:MAG: DUF4038 domain-containing protein [Planctomycetes bacterium]|nr:DUF4038 domain-containing protein [Planctomycetota bacterium]